jgi:hypothetical protein
LPDRHGNDHTPGIAAAARLADRDQLVRAALEACGAVGLVIAAEFNRFKELFTAIKGPALPAINLLALTGTIVMNAFHLSAHGSPNGFAALAIKRSAEVLIPLYALGEWLAIASVIYFNGADALVTQAADASRDLFVAPNNAGTPSIVSRVISLFSAACGGLAIVNMYAGKRLISTITDNVRDCIAKFHTHQRRARKGLHCSRANH